MVFYESSVWLLKKKSTRPIRLEHSNPKTERGFSVHGVTREQCWELRRNLNSK